MKKKNCWEFYTYHIKKKPYLITFEIWKNYRPFYLKIVTVYFVILTTWKTFHDIMIMFAEIYSVTTYAHLNTNT